MKWLRLIVSKDFVCSTILNCDMPLLLHIECSYHKSANQNLLAHLFLA